MPVTTSPWPSLVAAPCRSSLPICDASDIAHADRRTAARIEHDIVDVVDVLYESDAADDVLLIAVLDKIRARVLVVRWTASKSDLSGML